MISVEEIDKTILDLENHDTTYATCEKLAWLYIVRDHIVGTPALNVSRETPEVKSDSEFVRLASGVDFNGLMNILDEHMDAIKLLYPKEYDAIINKMVSLHDTH